VSRRLEHDQSAIRRERCEDLLQQAAAVGHLVQHVDGHGNVAGPAEGAKTRVVRRAHYRADAILESRTPRAPQQSVDHVLLKVHRDDGARRADEARESQREEAHPAAGLDHSHARTQEGRKQPFRGLEQPP